MSVDTRSRITSSGTPSSRRDPPISVLVPVRDSAETVAKALRSTLRALRRDDLVLVLDDGSTDRTWQAIASVAATDARVVPLRSSTNRGVARSLNVLLAEAGTELVARMDADDIVLPWRFELQRRALDGDCDVNFTTVVERRTQSCRLRPQVPSPISPDAVPTSLLLGNALAHSTMLARREVLMQVGAYRQVPSEDYDLWMRLVLAGRRIRRLAFPGLVYQRSAGQVTASSAWVTSARHNPLTAQVHSALLRRELRWTQSELFSALRSEPRPDLRADVERLVETIEERVRSEPASGSFALRRQLRATRRRWAAT